MKPLLLALPAALILPAAFAAPIAHMYEQEVWQRLESATSTKQNYLKKFFLKLLTLVRNKETSSNQIGGQSVKSCPLFSTQKSSLVLRFLKT